ncbi:MAG: Cupin domain protein [Parcubacteria group bacterium ADurb.Bin316]|nr:MAG: Cupin domain protein [Parcubacteria group bacterium ADurb.Bin316]HOZ55799.1 cupin domain-containing protein [bacterium]
MTIEIRKPSEEEIKMAETWPTWTKEVSEFPWSYNEPETCLILKGKAEVTTKEGETVSFGAGDFVIFPAGLECTWKIIEPIEKKYKFGE